MPRKAKNFDRNIFEKLCHMQCTRDEICYIFETTDKTLNAWCRREYGKPFLEIYAEKTEGGKLSKRRFEKRMTEKIAGK